MRTRDYVERNRLNVIHRKDATIRSLVDLAQARAEEAPERVAFTFLADGEEPGPALTLGEFHRRACAAAAALQERGAQGERVLLLYPPGLDFLTAFFGCLYAKAVAVPAYPPDPARLARSIPRLTSIADDAEARVALTVEAIRKMREGFKDTSHALSSMAWVATDALDLTAADAWAPQTITGDTLAYLQYTSGSTSTPKGVMISHQRVLANLGVISDMCDADPGDTLVTWAPQFHDMGLVLGLIWPLYENVHSVAMSPLDFLRRPVRWLQALSRFKGTHSVAPNFGFDLCVRKIAKEEREGLDLSRWGMAMCGAEPVQWGTLQAFAQAFSPYGFHLDDFAPGYGLAEAVLTVSCVRRRQKPVCLRVKGGDLERHRIVPAEAGDADARELVACGPTYRDTQVRIVCPERCVPCAEEEVGEIWISGSSVAEGYWRKPDASEETFNGRLADTGEGPFLRTGDLGFLRDGHLYVTGRIKDLIIVRGANHYPHDIEATVSKSHRALRPGCASAFSVTGDGDERLVVVQELRERFLQDLAQAAPVQARAATDEVIRAIRKAVADEHDVQAYGVVLIKPHSLLKTSSGKIQRKACHAAFLEGSFETVAQDLLSTEPAGSVPDEAPEDTPGRRMRQMPAARRQGVLEGYLRRAAAQALSLHEDEISAGTPLLELGLDSMKAMELIGDIERDLQVRLEPRHVFDHGSILALATYLSEELEKTSATAETDHPWEVEEGSI